MTENTEELKPKRVRLIEDYLDFQTGISYASGTILERTQSGQYAPPGTKLGEGGCVAFFALIQGICKVET